MWGLRELGICTVCGNKVYDTLSMRGGWKKVDGEYLHQECYLKMKAEEKANRIIESVI